MGGITPEQAGEIIPESVGGLSPEWWAQSLRNHQLPKYAPELNDIEVVWRDLKAHHLAHQTFTDAEALDREIHAAVQALNRERNANLLVNWQISA